MRQKANAIDPTTLPFQNRPFPPETPLIPLKKNIDLNLLACLDALLTEGSVTRAAERLNMSQPGMSHALSRLRALTGDALFVRSGNDFIPTERAQALAGKVRVGLAAMEEIFSEEGPFDPATTAGKLTVAAVDSVGVLLIPLLAQALAKEAPMVAMHVRLPDPEQLREWLAEGECDIALGFFPDVNPELHGGDLFGQELSIISGPSHPLRGQPMDFQQYADSTHVIFGSPFSERSPMEGAIDQALKERGIERRHSVQVSSMLLVPYVIAASPHVAALPTWLARQYADMLSLDVRPMPMTHPPILIRMLWHDRTHRTGLHRWVRQLVRSLTRELARTEGAISVAQNIEGTTFPGGM
jgi:DNA-binding transcriptional LysR family regulator